MHMREDVTSASRNASTDARHEREALHNPNDGYQLYVAWCKAKSVEKAGRSTYRGFMESFAVRRAHASTCEDSVIINKDGQLAVFEDEYIPLICTLAGKPQMIIGMKKRMAWIRRFLRVDYAGQHCGAQSSCCTHCITGALSGSEAEFDTTGSLTEPWGILNCPSCDKIPQLFHELQSLCRLALRRSGELDAALMAPFPAKNKS